ncbi:MAG TPA: hypothetical protein VIF62_26415, partial [Labilithrix sp.]
MAAGAKVLSVVAAERLVAGDVRAAAALGVVVTALYAVRRAVGSSGQILAHCDVQRALGRATLAGDVLEAPEQDAILVMIEGGHEAARLIVDTVPEIVSDAVAFAAVAPLLARDVSSRVMGTVGVALVAIVACLIAARRLARGLDERAWTAQERAVFRAIAIVEGRLEIVTRSAERRALLALDEALALYATAARRASWATALLGRAALAAGLVAAVACAFFVAPDLLESQRAHDSILLASALPIVFGLVQAASGLARARTRTAPIVDVLARPARRDVSRGGKVPPLPAA